MDQRASQYADIIDLPHHVSKRHPQMALSDRAAQFGAYSALRGYDEAVTETVKNQYIKQKPILKWSSIMTKMAENKTYLCIDLKSFFASVECVERGLDPLCTNLVVADAALTEKTICLAVSPSLKKYGIGGRARLLRLCRC